MAEEGGRFLWGRRFLPLSLPQGDVAWSFGHFVCGEFGHSSRECTVHQNSVRGRDVHLRPHAQGFPHVPTRSSRIPEVARGLPSRQGRQRVPMPDRGLRRRRRRRGHHPAGHACRMWFGASRQRPCRRVTGDIPYTAASHGRHRDNRRFARSTCTSWLFVTPPHGNVRGLPWEVPRPMGGPGTSDGRSTDFPFKIFETKQMF